MPCQVLKIKLSMLSIDLFKRNFQSCFNHQLNYQYSIINYQEYILHMCKYVCVDNQTYTSPSRIFYPSPIVEIENRSIERSNIL